jgi:hypothetical protein
MPCSHWRVWMALVAKLPPEPLVYHGGSNEKNPAHIWIEPRRDFAMVVVTNIAGSKADEALFARAPELYAKFAAPKRGRKSTR